MRVGFSVPHPPAAKCCVNTSEAEAPKKDPALFTEPSCYPPASADYRAVGSSDTHQLLKGTTKDDDPSKEEDQDEEEQPGDY